MADYKLDGPIKAALDTATNNVQQIAYWRDDENTVWLTNRAHLEYLNSLALYTIDVDDVISALQNLEINQSAGDPSPIEEVAGGPVLLQDLSDIQVESPTPGDLLTWDSDGKIKNFPKPDLQYKHTNTLFATTGGGEDDEDLLQSFTNVLEDNEDDEENASKWSVIGKAYLTANCVDTADYKITINFVCSVANNNRSFVFGIFKNNQEIENFSQEFNFSRKDDQKSITIIEYIKDVKKGDIISLRAKKGSGSSSTLSVYRRSIFLEELR